MLMKQVSSCHCCLAISSASDDDPAPPQHPLTSCQSAAHLLLHLHLLPLQRPGRLQVPVQHAHLVQQAQRAQRGALPGGVPGRAAGAHHTLVQATAGQLRAMRAWRKGGGGWGSWWMAFGCSCSSGGAEQGAAGQTCGGDHARVGAAQQKLSSIQGTSIQQQDLPCIVGATGD